MVYIQLAQNNPHKLSFYLAMEEYVAKALDLSDDCFFMWQVEPTVIFGRNQQMENEVNIAYCQQHGIQVVQRKSGGGCVYADMDNIMLSYISSETHVGQAFNCFVNMLLLLFRKMGIEAVGTTHNDIMIGDRKVCGTACYHLSGRNIIHSTLLYDTNMENMLNAITPGVEKLEAKGIKSVRQRITLLKDHVNLSCEEVKALIRQTLCNGELLLTSDDITAIEHLEIEYDGKQKNLSI